jgi:hypothetical protein
VDQGVRQPPALQRKRELRCDGGSRGVSEPSDGISFASLQSN